MSDQYIGKLAMASICSIAVLLPAVAYAQSSVTLYGSIDDGLVYVTKRAGSKLAEMSQGNLEPDRWGLRGTEDIGAGNTIVFQLENGFFSNTGAMRAPGSIFDRQAWIGVSSNWGTLTLGNHYDNLLPTLSFKYSNAVLGGGFNDYHPGNIDNLAIAPPTAADPAVFANSIYYQSPSMAGLVVRGEYRVPGGGSVRAASYGANYDRGPFSIGIAYSHYNNRQYNVTGPLGITSLLGQGGLSTGNLLRTDEVSTFGAGALYTLGKFSLHALATDTQLKYRGIKETYRSIEAGSGFLVTPASKLVADVSRTTLAGNRWLQFTVGDVYSLSKRTQLYAWVRYQTAGGAAQQAAIWAIGPAGAGNRNQGMVMAGIHHGF